MKTQEGAAEQLCRLTVLFFSCIGGFFNRVLVLYLGNLYSLIIALLDKVDSMSIAVSTVFLTL